LIAYPDTSFLCALYRAQDNSPSALTYRAEMTEPLHVTRLLLWEFRQSVRFQAFRHSHNRQLGYPLHEAEKMIAKLTEHIDAESVRMVNCDFIDVLVAGERISKSSTFPGGHRSFDILHVATALELGAKEFLTFDSNQITLATNEGMLVPLEDENQT
jgi:predicted nucleic acid-binding protein